MSLSSTFQIPVMNVIPNDYVLFARGVAGEVQIRWVGDRWPERQIAGTASRIYRGGYSTQGVP